MIIDGHAHACGGFLTAESIINILDANRVDKVLLTAGEPNSAKTYNLPNIAGWFPDRDVIAWTNTLSKLILRLSGTAQHIHEGNAYVYGLARQAPDRILQCYWVMLSHPNMLEEVAQRFQDWRFRCIKLHQCWEPFTVRSTPFDELATWAGAQDLPIFLHMARKPDVQALIEYIRTHPQITFIIAHLFALEAYIQADLRVNNVYFDISTPPLISLRRLEKAIAHFGAQRIVLGSDTPYGKESLRVNLQRVRALPLSDEEKQMILGGNLQKILRLA